jgi:predicted peptidase
MGGAGVWNMLGNRPSFFAAAVICCGGVSPDDGTGSIETALGDFHGPTRWFLCPHRVTLAARRKAGGHPIYTEYAGVDHNGATGVHRTGAAEVDPEEQLYSFLSLLKGVYLP